MRITSLSIRNLRALESCEVSDVGQFVVLAGPNGCGKTTVLDAIRILKSAYLGDEWRRWFNEFGINVDRPTNWEGLFRRRDKPVTVEATFELAEGERRFLLDRAGNITLALAQSEATNKWATITGDAPFLPPSALHGRDEEIRRGAAEAKKLLTSALEAGSCFSAGVHLTNEPRIEAIPSPIAQAAFSCFNPGALGEIEFHTSRRNYARDAVSSVRLNLGDRTEERRSRFLYDLENKYRNIKTQLSEEYVASVLRGMDPDEAPLQRSIKELFRTFFPGKEFVGVTVGTDNALSFPVRLATGETHDIDELSSGEKEIVYGYLWLRTGTPKGSIILVDEPELHLNPALVQGLPAFYKEHLADALEAQVWIVTHSDGILRQAVRSSAMAVYHLARATGGGRQQATRIDGQDAVEAAVLDLIGDLAAYRPHARIVLLEGSKETRFDVEVVRRLFPELAERANFIPAGSSNTTTGVRTRLQEILKESGLTGRAVSITDGDLRLRPDSSTPGQYAWPVYEIENFLVEPSILRGALSLLLGRDPYANDEVLLAKLRQIAEIMIPTLAVIEVQHIVNRDCVGALKIGAGAERPVDNLYESANKSRQRFLEIDLSKGRINDLYENAHHRLSGLVKSGEFLSRFPGDRLLRYFAGEHDVNGDHFRNACLDFAQRARWRPQPMERTLVAAIG